MIRHLLGATLPVIVLSGSLLFLPSSANAQGFMGGGAGGGGFLSDPFNFYYAFYLPNQAMQAMRPRPIDTLNQNVVSRQYYAQTDRRALYNPISAYGDQTFDPNHPYAGQGKERLSRAFRFAQDPSNADGSGPSLYYGRAREFFPGLRVGRAPNANVYGRTSRALSTPRALGGRGGGGGGMGGMGGGMGGGGMGGGFGGMGGMGGMMSERGLAAGFHSRPRVASNAGLRMLSGARQLLFAAGNIELLRRG